MLPPGWFSITFRLVTADACVDSCMPMLAEGR